MERQLLEFLDKFRNCRTSEESWALFVLELQAIGGFNVLFSLNPVPGSLKMSSGITLSGSIKGGQSETERYDIKVPVYDKDKLEIGYLSFGYQRLGSADDLGTAIDLSFINRMLEIFYMHFESLPLYSALLKCVNRPIEELTTSEKCTIHWLANGFSIRQIAEDKIYKSVESVNLYIKSAKKKLNSRTRDQMIAKAMAIGVI